MAAPCIMHYMMPRFRIQILFIRINLQLQSMFYFCLTMSAKRPPCDSALSRMFFKPWVLIDNWRPSGLQTFCPSLYSAAILLVNHISNSVRFTPIETKWGWTQRAWWLLRRLLQLLMSCRCWRSDSLRLLVIICWKWAMIAGFLYPVRWCLGCNLRHEWTCVPHWDIDRASAMGSFDCGKVKLSFVISQGASGVALQQCWIHSSQVARDEKAMKGESLEYQSIHIWSAERFATISWDGVALHRDQRRAVFNVVLGLFASPWNSRSGHSCYSISHIYSMDLLARYWNQYQCVLAMEAFKGQ